MRFFRKSKIFRSRYHSAHTVKAIWKLLEMDGMVRIKASSPSKIALAYLLVLSFKKIPSISITPSVINIDDEVVFFTIEKVTCDMPQGRGS